MDLDELVAAVASAGACEVSGVSQPEWGLRLFREGAEGLMTIAGQQLRFGVGLLPDFPGSLPKVVCLSAEALRLPHVEAGGFVCAFEAENTLHDYRHEADIVRETVERARTVIEDGLLGANHNDFLDEFEAYWPGDVSVVSTVLPTVDPHEVRLSFSGAELVAVADSVDELGVAFPSLRKEIRKGLYLPLDPVKVRAVHPRDLATWEAILPCLADESKALIQRTRVAKRQTLGVVLGLPRPSGGVALVGLVLRRFRLDGQLSDVEPTRCVPFKLDRFDDQRARERLTADSRQFRAIVIGCGAVGGHVTQALAWSGANELTLVDPDKLSGPNTFRHVLGRAGWRKHKVEGLKQEIEGHLPGLAVKAIASGIDGALMSNAKLLERADVIVVAIGNHTMPLRLSDAWSARKMPVPVVYTWLEPYGVGGHALVVRHDRPGCFRCLFEDSPELRCAVEFAGAGQRFAKRELGCHSLYTPYSDLDARETALSAARLALEVVQDRNSPSSLRSWRGNASAFLSAGFRLSPRYEAPSDELSRALSPRPGCTACGT